MRFGGIARTADSNTMQEWDFATVVINQLIIFFEMENSKEVKTKSYTLFDKNGSWLGQIVLSSDGLFASVTDWGNLSYAWRAFGNQDFRAFLCGLNEDYFAQKMFIGMSYILHGKKCELACKRYASRILPALKEVLREDLQTNSSF